MLMPMPMPTPRCRCRDFQMALLHKWFNFKITLPHLRLYKKNFCRLLYNHQECVTIFEDETTNNKTLEHASLIFTELWALGNEIMLNIMQNLKFDFLENKF